LPPLSFVISCRHGSEVVESQSTRRSTFPDRKHRWPTAGLRASGLLWCVHRCLFHTQERWPFKLISYVLMPDHIHLIVNPKDGRIRELAGALKSLSARRIIGVSEGSSFLRDKPDVDGSIHQVWQESFKALPLWSDWLIWQKINYIHNNPIKSGLVRSAAEYRWSSFRSFYSAEREPIKVDKDWWWPHDVQKLASAAADWSAEMGREERD